MPEPGQPPRPKIGLQGPRVLAGLVVAAVIAAAIALWLRAEREPAISTPTSIDTDAAPAPTRSPPSPALARDPTPPPASPAIPAEPLPALDDSDTELASVLGEALGTRAFAETARADDIVRRLVLTIDSLPRQTLSLERRIVAPIDGNFVVRGSDDELYLANGNYARYAAFTTLVSRIDARTIDALYRRYYPLLQEAYLELGYTEQNFSARVHEVIDHMLEAPEIGGSIALTRPNVLYEYADPALESSSAGHKIMIRMGPINAAIIKAKLREVRPLLTR